MDIGIGIGLRDADPVLTSLVDIHILAGQSNGDGRGSVGDLPSFLTSFYASKQNNLRIYYKPSDRNNGRVSGSYFVDDGQFYTIAPRHDDITDETSMTISSATVDVTSDVTHGLEISFAHAWAQANPNRELVFLKLALGGSTINGQWAIAQSDPTSNWEYFVNYIWTPAIADLTAEGKALGNVVFHWVQGENDANSSEVPYNSVYYGHLQTLRNRIITDLGLTNPKMIINQLANIGYASVGSTLGAWNSLKAAQAQFVADTPNTQLLITDGTGNYPIYPLSNDNLHFGSSSLVEIGYQAYAMTAPTKPSAIADLAVSTTATTATLSWSRSYGALNYLVQYKLTSSSTWTTDATLYAVPTSYTISSLTNNESYDFRIVANNAKGATNSNLVNVQITAPPSLQQISSAIQIDLTTVYETSYDGTSQTWTNIVENKTEPDFWLGFDGNVDTTDPVFTGSAGTNTAYFAMDRTTDKRFTAKSLTTLLSQLHRSDYSGSWTVTLHFRYSTTNRVLFATSNITNSAGLWIQVATSNNNLRVRFYNATSGVTTIVTTTEQFTINQDNIFSFAFNNSTRAYSFNINGATGSGTGSSYTNTDTSVNSMTIGAQPNGISALSSDARVYGVAIANTALNTSEMTAIHNAMLARRT